MTVSVIIIMELGQKKKITQVHFFFFFFAAVTLLFHDWAVDVV